MAKKNNEAVSVPRKHQGEFEMRASESDKKSPRPAADLVDQYRPLGLKAVLAAALQVKPKPAKTPVSPKQREEA